MKPNPKGRPLPDDLYRAAVSEAVSSHIPYRLTTAAQIALPQNVSAEKPEPDSTDAQDVLSQKCK